MKKIHLSLLLLAGVLFVKEGLAQNVGINEDGSLANPNAMLDVKSNRKGILIPRMSTAARLAIPNTIGLMVYDSTARSFFYNDGAAWQSLGAVNTGWTLTTSGGKNTITGIAQNVAVNEDGSAPNENAILDVKSNNKGILIPRMSSTARLEIPNTLGLLVYDSTVKAFFYNDGAKWQNMIQTVSAGNGWLLTGNSGTTRSNFIGTTDNVPLTFKLNNQVAGWMESSTRKNMLLGYNAGSSVIMDSTAFGITGNTAIGYGALHSLTNAIDNTAIGAGALASNRTGHDNTAIGADALAVTDSGYYNTAVGSEALESNTKGVENAALGAQSLSMNTTGSSNTAMGSFALKNNTTGTNNAAFGSTALLLTTTGVENTAVGQAALSGNTTGSNNTSVGTQTLNFNLGGSNNTAIGHAAMYISQGNLNTAIGSNALSANSSGSENVAIGYSSAANTKNSGENTALGTWSMLGNTTGSYNVAIGYFSLLDNKIGTENTSVGAFSDIWNGSVNATAIGFGAVANASNKVRIGNSSVTVIEGQVPFTTPSDGRFKYEVKEDVKGLDFIMQLRPVTYQFDVKRFDEQMHKTVRLSGNDATKKAAEAMSKLAQASYDEASAIRRSGFIAQEVEKAANATGYDFSGIIKPKTEQDHYSLSYESFVVPLVKAVQEQQRTIQAQQQKIVSQNEKMDAQEKKLNNMQQQIDELKQLLQHK